MPLQPAYTSNELISPKKKKGCRGCQSKPARKGTRVLPKAGPGVSAGAGPCPTCKKKRRRASGTQPKA